MGVYTEAVQKLYVAYFSRPADAAGLAYWESVVANMNGDTTAVSAAFAASQEYTDSFAGQSPYQIINTIYLNLFGRPAEAAALTFWGQGLLNNSFTIDTAVTTIAGAAQTTDRDAYVAKVAAATAFTAALDTPAEILGYTGTNANNAAKAWLANITTDAGYKAAIEPAALANTVNAVASIGGTVGQTFTLTAGVDTFVGTNGNDVFNALSVDPTGKAGSTLTAFDSITGNGGNDTLNVYTTGSENTELLATTTVTGIETINVYNTGTPATLADASKFAGVTALNQIGTAAAAVTNLAATTTAGFQSTNGAISVAAAAAAKSASLNVKSVVESSVVTVTGAALAGINLSGTVVDGADAGTAVGSLAVNATAGKDVGSFTLNSSVATTLTVAETGTSTTKLTAIDASPSTGAVTYVGTAGVSSIRGGAGADVLTLNTLTNIAATGVTAINATLDSGAGKDTITVATTGTGTTTVDAGAGDDTVTVNSRSDGKLTVNLGDGNDTFKVATGVTVNAGDMIDAGAGTDTLSLSLVGSANIGAFSNFDLFDAAGLGRTLDVEILASKNTVTEFIASGNVGAAVLTNVGAGVGVRVTGDMAGSTLIVNQKTAGALTVTVDADETATTGTDAAELVTGAVTTNATSIKAVFDTSYLADTAAEKALGATADNYTTLSLTAAAATSMEIVSGGTNATNNINITASDKLTSVTVTGTQQLTIGDVTVPAGTGTTPVTSKLASIDASALTGGLIVGTDDIANGGTIKLGSGVDVVTVSASSLATAAGFERVSGLEKAAAAAVSTSTDAAAVAARDAAIVDADTLVFNGASMVADGTTTGATVAKGVLTFTGAGPGDLAAAFAIADAAAATDGNVVVFEYLGNSYLFQQAGAADIAVQLVGITGISALGENLTDGVFIV
jgi:hypothetical protein